VYKAKGNLDEALKYYNDALKIRKAKAPDSLALAGSYNNIGLVYKAKGDQRTADEYLKRAEEIKKRAR
jgi:tetratricopeptide (TPR) repeat protein